MKTPAVSAASLTPAPVNDFPEFIEVYYNECRSRFPKIEAIAGKWCPEDLIPGLSDFDSRFICADNMTAEDWCRMSRIVGQVHLDLCRQYPQWARILEHLPGINLTWEELGDEFSYYPEYKQWTFYHNANPQRLAKTLEHLAQRPWDLKDEYFHLKKFLLYYARYNSALDPPINLGTFLSKYPLHSRVMHYFSPPLQSAVSILRKESVRGKQEAFRLAQTLLPDTRLFSDLLALIGRHYHGPELYRPEALAELDHRLFEALQKAAERLTGSIVILPRGAGAGPGDWRKQIEEIAIDPALLIFDNVKFSRLMKGRLFFYGNAPAVFDHIPLIHVELSRIGGSFFRTPFSIFWELTTGEIIADPSAIVPRLAPSLLTSEEVRATLEFDRLTRLEHKGREVEIARQIVEVYDGFYRSLFKINGEIRKLRQTHEPETICYKDIETQPIH